MLTFEQFLKESSGMKTAAVIGIAVKIRSLHQQISQDRTASKADKLLSQEILWLASMITLGVVAENR